MGGEASCSGGGRIIECRLPNVELVDYLVWYGISLGVFIIKHTTYMVVRNSHEKVSLNFF